MPYQASVYVMYIYICDVMSISQILMNFDNVNTLLFKALGFCAIFLIHFLLEMYAFIQHVLSSRSFGFLLSLTEFSLASSEI